MSGKINPMEWIGRNAVVYMMDGTHIYFMCFACGVNYISGCNDEGLNMMIKISDIDYMVGI